MKLTSYPTYKDSGVPWLGDVPEYWEVRRLKWVASLNPSKAEALTSLEANTPVMFLPMECVGTDGRIDARETPPASAVWNGFTYFRREDVLVAKITPCFENGKGACLDSLPTEIGFGSTEFHVLRARSSVSPQFLYRLTTVAEFRRLGADAMIGAAGQQRVPQAFLANYPIALPPLPEQAAIVRFLDHADRRIRCYIQAKQKLIKLLEEEKQAIIYRAVTRGLDPNVRLKPSGVPWLGDVPEHWEVRRLKFLAHIKTGGRDTVDRKDDGDYPFFVRSQTVERIDSFSFDGEAVLTAGDGAGVAKVFHYVVGKFDYHQRVYKFSNFRHIRGKLFFYCFSSTLRCEAFRETAKSTVDSLRLPMLQNFPVPLPPSDEQLQIVEAIERETVALERSLATIKHEISFLREYRTRLIADVVTGKLDVRETAARLPDEPAEAELLDEADALTEAEDAPSDDLDAVSEEAEA